MHLQTPNVAVAFAGFFKACIAKSSNLLSKALSCKECKSMKNKIKNKIKPLLEISKMLWAALKSQASHAAVCWCLLSKNAHLPPGLEVRSRRGVCHDELPCFSTEPLATKPFLATIWSPKIAILSKKKPPILRANANSRDNGLLMQHKT